MTVKRMMFPLHTLNNASPAEKLKWAVEELSLPSESIATKLLAMAAANSLYDGLSVSQEDSYEESIIFCVLKFSQPHPVLPGFYTVQLEKIDGSWIATLTGEAIVPRRLHLDQFASWEKDDSELVENFLVNGCWFRDENHFLTVA